MADEGLVPMWLVDARDPRPRRLSDEEAAPLRAEFAAMGIPTGPRLTEQEQAQVREALRRDYGGPSGWHEMVRLDGDEADYQAIAPADLGLTPRQAQRQLGARLRQVRRWLRGD